MKHIDIHCHLNLPEFDFDMVEVIARAKERDVGMIVVGVDKVSSEKAVKIAEENENIWAVVGLHPVDNTTEIFDYEFYKKLALHPKVVGIGETGLDYFHGKIESRQGQVEVFEKQIALANEVKKPLMLHIRNGLNGDKKEGNAYADSIEILKKHAKVHGNVHFFAGSLQDAHEFVKIGFKLSFTGVISFARNYDEVIKNIPLNMIMSETDSPFVAPVPYRGQRNEPSYVIEVIHKIAEIRGETVDKVGKSLLENAKTVFKL